MIEVERRVATGCPVLMASTYLSDFATSADWDPHTARCVRVDDPGRVEVGATYDTTQRLGPVRTTLRYEVIEYEPGRSITLRSTGRLLEAIDAMRFSGDEHGSVITYTARFRLHPLARAAEPVLRRVMEGIADDGAAGMRRALEQLYVGPIAERR